MRPADRAEGGRLGTEPARGGQPRGPGSIRKTPAVYAAASFASWSTLIQRGTAERGEQHAEAAIRLEPQGGDSCSDEAQAHDGRQQRCPTALVRSC